MKKAAKAAAAILLIGMLSVTAGAAETVELGKRERAILCRSIAQSYPGETYAAYVGMAAVVRNRMDRDGIGCAEAITAMAEEGAFPELDRLAMAVDEKRYRVIGDAVSAALDGADPTMGAMHFGKFEGNAGWAADLYFDDRREDRERAQILSQAVGCPVLIDGVGFW